MTSDDDVFVVRWDNGEGGVTEGPLNVLWSLIESYKIDILSVSLSRITNDFLQYLRIQESLTLSLGGEFALMAANLIYLKSKALLPDPGFEDEDYDPPLPPELVEKLLEHKKFQMVASRLGDLDRITSAMFTRAIQGGQNSIIQAFKAGNTSTQEGEVAEEVWLDVSLVDLLSAFNEILNRDAKNEEEIQLYEGITHKHTVAEKIDSITSQLSLRGEFYFHELFSDKTPDRMEIVVSFLAILEIVKQRWARVVQNGTFGVIKLTKLEETWKEIVNI